MHRYSGIENWVTLSVFVQCCNSVFSSPGPGIENSVNNINQTSRTGHFMRNNKYDGDMLEASDRPNIIYDIQVLFRNCEF